MDEYSFFFTFNLFAAVLLASATLNNKLSYPHPILVFLTFLVQLSVLAIVCSFARLIHVASSTKIYVKVEGRSKVIVNGIIILALVFSTFLRGGRCSQRCSKVL